MNRRGFLQLLGAGLPAAVVCEKVGLLERVRTYFFAPQAGWGAPPVLRTLTNTEIVALQLEKVRAYLPTLYNNDSVLFDVMSLDGKTKRGQMRAPMPYNHIEWDKAVIL